MIITYNFVANFTLSLSCGDWEFGATQFKLDCPVRGERERETSTRGPSPVTGASTDGWSSASLTGGRRTDIFLL